MGAALFNLKSFQQAKESYTKALELAQHLQKTNPPPAQTTQPELEDALYQLHMALPQQPPNFPTIPTLSEGNGAKK